MQRSRPPGILARGAQSEVVRFPLMSKANLLAIRQLVSLCLDPAGTPRPADPESWEELVSLALYHGVAAFLGLKLNNLGVPQPVRARLRALYLTNLVRNQEMKAEQEKVLAALSNQAIPACPLKGAHLSESLYGDIGVRQVGDIDVLIRPQDLEKADHVLAELGYVRGLSDELAHFRRSQELIYRKPASQDRSFYLDVHQRLLPYVRQDPLAESVWASGMTKENLLLYLCLNQVAHRFARLMYVLDIKVLLDRTAEGLDWNLIVSLARELEFTPGVYYSLESVCELAGARIPGSVLAALRPDRFDRRLARWVLGADPTTTLARGPTLAGPYGAFAILACTRSGGARLRQAWRLLFPPAAYMRQAYWAQPHQATLPFYVDRLVRKVPAAMRHLFKAGF